MTARRVLLIIGGGIAAYKSLETIRLMRKAGIDVTAILTRAAKEFVTPLSVAALTEDKVYDDLFSLTDEVEMGHIELSRAADLLVVAPATADLMAKAANGHADDLASTALLATDKPVMFAPAMNVRMWEHPATRRNLATLRSDSALVVGPNEGSMACGEFGYGRMAEPAEIFAAIESFFRAEPKSGPQAIEGPKPLSGRHVLVTAGPTHEPIDPVRYLANRSSGKQGYAIAEAARDLGADVTLVSGPVALPPPSGVTMRAVETAHAMAAAVEAALPADVGVFAAAVGDWRVETEASQKMKKSGDDAMTLRLVANPDILKTVAHGALRPRLVIGFAAETENVLAHARAKLAKKGADAIVANDVSPGTGVMGGSRNRVVVVTQEGEDAWPELSKEETARRLMSWAAARLESTDRAHG